MTDETQGRVEKMRGLREQEGEKLDDIVYVRRMESVVVIGHTSDGFLSMPESQGRRNFIRVLLIFTFLAFVKLPVLN
jgi:hypothetical protein